MKKEQIYKEIASVTGLTAREAKEITNIVFHIIRRELISKGKVRIPGVARIEIRLRKDKRGRMSVMPKIRLSTRLKETVKNAMENAE